MNFFLIYILGIFLACFSTVAWGQIQRYHCKFPNIDPYGSSFDKMVQVRVFNSDQRAVFTNYFSLTQRDPIKTYDEGNVIVTVYEDFNTRKYHPDHIRLYQVYQLLKIDTSSHPVTFRYGYANHDTVEGFEKIYGIPYTETNFNAKNRHPEILKYIPPKEHEQHISFGFWRGELYDCGEPINYFKYKIIYIMTLFFSILGSI